jgi:hypothetical protein
VGPVYRNIYISKLTNAKEIMLETSRVYISINQEVINLCHIRICQQIFRYSKNQYTKEMWFVVVMVIMVVVVVMVMVM